MFKNLVKGNTKNPLNDTEKEWIKSNHQNTTVVDMAIHLKRACNKIYDYLYENDLSVFRKQSPRRGTRHLKSSKFFNEHEMKNWIL